MAAGDPLQPAASRRALTEIDATTTLSGADLARLIDHRFARPELLAEALTHPSALPPHRKGRRRVRRAAPRPHYERLEFLGDRVLGLVIADLLWRRFADEPEGHLTRRLTHLVRRDALARVAAAMDIGAYLLLSPAEAAAGAARNPGILADVLEAVIAAIYLDAGFPAAFAFVERWWAPLIAEMDAPPRDAKTSLQEWAQARGLPLPAYRLVATSGPDHAPQFTVAVQVSDRGEASGVAASKRAAETAAAAAMLEQLSGTAKTDDAEKDVGI